MTILSTFVTACYDFFRKPGVLLLAFTLCYVFWFDDFLKPYNKDKNQTNFVGEVMDQYSYLPAAFFNEGSFDFKDAPEKSLPINVDGRYYPRHTYGMALLYTPFFGAGAAISAIKGEDGSAFSTTMADCIRCGMIFYVLIGLCFLREFLLFWFNEIVTAFSLFAVFYGSMLYFYTFTHAELEHAGLFSLFCIFLYYVAKWHREPKFVYALILSLVFGLVSLIHFTEVYLVVIFLLWNVKNLENLREKWKFLKSRWRELLLFPVMMLVFWIPQFLFWKVHLGTYFFDTNGEEGFFWSDPQVLNILFSYRKGWLLYTPVVVLAFIGLFFIKKEFPFSGLVLAFVIMAMVYVYSCWWDWSYGAGFGNRAFCQMIAFLTIPIASLIDFVLYSEKKFPFRGEIGLLLIVLIFSCAFHNMGQAYQFQEQRKIHAFGMTKTAYWDVFRHFHYRSGYDQVFPTQLDFPDYNNWIKGIGRDDKRKKEETTP